MIFTRSGDTKKEGFASLLSFLLSEFPAFSRMIPQHALRTASSRSWFVASDYIDGERNKTFDFERTILRPVSFPFPLVID
jgi:hypothetical protein